MSITASSHARPARRVVGPAGLPSAFWALWSGQLINRLGGFVQPFLVLYLTQGQQVSATTAGAVAAAVGAGNIVSHLLGGWMSDHVGRRATLLVGFVGTAAAMAALGMAPNLAFIWASAFAVGVTSEIFRPAAESVVADMVGPETRVRAYGLLFWAVNLGFSISTVAAGFAVRFGFGLLFWVDAGTCLIAALIIWRAVPETRPAVAEGSRRSLVAVAVRDRALLGLVVLSTMYAVVYFQSYTTLPLAMEADGLAASTYGLVIAVNGVVVVVLQPFLLRFLERHDRSVLTGLSMLVVGLGFGAAVLADSALGYAGTVVVWTLGEIGYTTLIIAIFADLAPVDLRGGYMGIAGVTFALGATVGPLAGTAVLEHAGANTLWAGCVAVGVAMLVGQLVLAPTLRARAADLAGEGQVVTDPAVAR